MSEDITVQWTARLRDSDFALLLDESIDVSKMSHLLAYVRYEWEKEIKEDFFYCKELRTTTTASDVFDTLDDFMRNNIINWTNCIGVCTDGAAAMTWQARGSRAKNQSCPPPCRFNTLASMDIPDTMNF